MSSHRTFPKEGIKKDKETIRSLRAELKSKDREIKFLRDELNNVMKPQRTRKPQQVEVTPEVQYEDWKKDFVKRFKRDVLDKKE